MTSQSATSLKYKIRTGNPDFPVSMPCSAYVSMSKRWDLPHDLHGGTRRMREQGELWLPKEENEQVPMYRVRLRRSILYNAFADTQKKLASKPFSKEVVVDNDSLPKPLNDISHDVDRCGTEMTPFAANAWEAGTMHGLTHFLVDLPVVTQPLNAKQEQDQGIRPYFTHVAASDLIGWRFKKTSSGSKRLVSIRIWEETVVNDPSNPYTDRVVNRIRVINAPAPVAIDDDGNVEVIGTWEVWEQSDDKGDQKWDRVDGGTHSYDGVPLVTAYFNRTAYMQADPPLEDLAWLNLLHWQSLSDQRNILRVVRVSMLAGTGLSEKEVKATQTIGPNAMLKSTNKEAKYYFVEHSGKGIEAGTTDLKSIEERMEVMGLQPLVARTANDTATGKKINEGKNNSTVHMWVRALKGALRQCYEVSGKFYPTTLEIPDDFEVGVFSDFSALTLDTADLPTLLAMRQNNDITHRTYLEEMKRRGVLAESVNIDDEVSKSEDEAAKAFEMQRKLMEESNPLTGDDDLDNNEE